MCILCKLCITMAGGGQVTRLSCGFFLAQDKDDALPYIDMSPLRLTGAKGSQ